MNSARYEYQQGVAVWPIPFAYSDPSHVGVSLALPTGQEKALVHGRDFIITDDAVVYVLPKNHALIIYNNAPATSVAAFQARQLASFTRAQAAPAMALAAEIPVEETAPAEIPAVQEQSEPAAQAQAADNARLAMLEAQLKSLAEEQAKQLALERAKAADAQIQAVTEQGKAGITAIELNANAAIRQIDEVAKTASRSAVLSVAEATADADEAADKAASAAQNADIKAEDAEKRITEAIAKLEARIAELEAQADRKTEQAASAINAESNGAILKMRSAAASIQAENERASRLAGQAWPTQGWMLQEDDLAARSIMALPEPLAYYPGRNSLYIALNGSMLALGKHFEEVGTAASPSNTIRLLIPTNKTDLWAFWIAPTNEAQAASESAQKAETAAYNAARSEASAATAIKAVQDAGSKTLTTAEEKLAAITKQGQDALKAIRTSGETALAQIRSLSNATQSEAAKTQSIAIAQIRKEGETSSEAARQLWRKAELGIAEVRQEAQQKAEAALAECERNTKASSHAASQSQELAECAWRAAFQASLDKAMPGVASVGSYADLAGRPAGIYFINSRVKQPLPFMGVFPVDDIAEAIGYDGVFLIGAMPYPEAPALPDIPYPENPAEVPDMQPAAAVGQWLPCDHNHN